MSMRPLSPSRSLGTYGKQADGPLVLVVAGVHGNEPGGVLAATQVMRELHERQPQIAGRVVCLSGNRRALEAGVRFLDIDLNRIWSAEQIERARSRPTASDRAEDSEQRELLAAIETELGQARGPVIFLDLHSTSAGGAPFAIIGDTLQNRAIAFALKIPVILGLEENIDGTMLEYFGARGHVAVGFEGGQHDAPTTQAHHEAAIWITLVQAGLLQAQQVERYGEHLRCLERAGDTLPRVVEIVHRHDIRPEEEFRMNPGYVNFQEVRKDELLAHADPGRREVRSPQGGRILMPLYQSKGSDGFFLGRDVRPFWLWLSASLRRLRLDAVLALLPGLRRRAEAPGVLEVDRRIARFFATEIFHLLGYRRCEARGQQLVFTRRVEST